MSYLDKPITYKKIGIDFNSWRVVECLYAYGYHKRIGQEINKSFLLKNGRKPNNHDIDMINYFSNIKRPPIGIYQTNWMIYTTQSIYDKNYINILTEDVKNEFRNVHGYDPTYQELHATGRCVYWKKWKIDKVIYPPNVWQYMSICACLDNLNLQRKSESIITLFNKIYKRKPLDFEIELCTKLDLTMDGEVLRNEIISVVKVYYDFTRTKPINWKYEYQRYRY